MARGCRPDIGIKRSIAEMLARRDDAELARMMANLGGHCMETLCASFDAATGDTPTLFIAYTVKGYGPPFAGHEDNHAGLMTPAQIARLRADLGIAAGEEWKPWAGLGGNARAAVQALIEATPIARVKSAARAPAVPVPPLAPPEGALQEGGAHQQINPPLIAMGQPSLRHCEPAYADELAATIEESFRLMQAEDGESVYLRLTTRAIEQPARADDRWQADALAGGILAARAGADSGLAPVAMGAVMPETLHARAQLADDVPGMGCSRSLRPRCFTAAGAARALRAGPMAGRSRPTSTACSPRRPARN